MTTKSTATVAPNKELTKEERMKLQFFPIEDRIGEAYTSNVPDYHFICDEWTTKEERRKMNMGDIYANAAKCARCGDYIRSRNRHDFRTCKCGAISVDGGSWYMRRSGALSDCLDRTVNFKDMEPENL